MLHGCCTLLGCFFSLAISIHYIVNEHLPESVIRVVAVVDLYKLMFIMLPAIAHHRTLPQTVFSGSHLPTTSYPLLRLVTSFCGTILLTIVLPGWHSCV